MRLSTARVLLAVFLLAFLILGTRFAWVASHLETGWEAVAQHWHGSTLGRVGFKRVPIGQREPVDQADFWLAEVERVLNAQPQSAELAMGAAWVLDSPGEGFKPNYFKLEKFARQLMFPKPDYEATARARNQFEAKCSARCLELAALATRLDPDNVDWWRMRALLLFRNQWAARDPDWLATLDECARHDVDNALYDYLAAQQLWGTSADFDYDDEGWFIVVVKDPERFARGVARFERGQQKKYLTVGDAALPAVVEFLGHARPPRLEKVDVAWDRLFAFRASMLLMDLRDWQDRAEMRERDGDAAGALALWRQNVHLLDQVTAVDGFPELDRRDNWRQVMNIARIQEVAARHPTLISNEEMTDLWRRGETLSIEAKILEKADRQISPGRDDQRIFEAVPLIQWMAASQMLVIGLLVPGVLGWGLARWWSKREHCFCKAVAHGGDKCRLGTLRHLFAWVLGFGLTFCLLGMFPAEIVGRDAQRWIVGGLVGLVGLGLLITLFRKLSDLCRRWTSPPGWPSVVSIIAVVTLWQVAIAVLLLTGRIALEVPLWLPRALLDFSTNVLLFLTAPFLLAIALWVRWLLAAWRRTGRLPGPHFAALGLLAFSTVLVTGAFWLCPDFLDEVAWLPARGWEVYTTGQLWELFQGEERPWQWAGMQWFAYAGVYVSPSVAILLVAFWYAVRRARQSPEGFPRYWASSARARWAGVLGCVARSALAMAACCLLVYLAVTPGVLRLVESDYHDKMDYVRNPEGYRAKVRAAAAAIEADPKAMTQIRAEVIERIRVDTERQQRE